MKRVLRLTVLAAFAVVVFALSANAQLSFTGEVIEIVDGRTVVVRISTGQIKVQLQYIDVPDAGQPAGKTVSSHLRDLVMGKIVQYRPTSIRDDRTIGQLTLNGIDLSQQMLRDGAAWHIPSLLSGQEARNYDLYASFAAAAQREKRGLWSVEGLRPAWEMPPDTLPTQIPQQPTIPVSTRTTPPAANVNPALGSVGALVNSYDPATKTGYISTTFQEIVEQNKELSKDRKAVADLTYFYQEDEKKGRKGVFIFSMISVAKNVRFLTNNVLTITGEGNNIVVGRPKRTVAKDGENVREKLTYEISRNAIDRIVNGNDVYIKVGDYMILPSAGLKFMLYNVLEVAH
ncbi:MAG: thermonuclease family protein [Pyrinomonadaceae bacterium]